MAKFREMWTAGTWRAVIGIPVEVVTAIRGAAADCLPPDRYEISTKLVGEEQVDTLAIDIDVDSDDDEREVATIEWHTLRAAAGLPFSEPFFVGFEWTSFEDDRHDVLRREADEFMSEQRYDLAVLRAQTSCEVLARKALAGGLRAELGRQRGDALTKRRALRLSFSLGEARTLELLDVLTGHRPSREPWWSDYREHLARRNGVTHEGLRIARADAEKSLAAVDACRAWLKDFWAGRPV